MEMNVERLSSSHHDPSADRERLLRFCRRLTGDAGRAEDLAQETLLRAWQHADQLRDPERRDAWLKAIARNLSRQSLRERAQLPLSLVLDETGDAFDQVELDRRELASLLDRAMALLPAETREVLIERFIRESPIAETAGRLGLSEGAVTMRLQRGKLALRRVLVSAFPDDLQAYGLGRGLDGPTWRATRIWCPECGQHRLDGILIRDLGLFRLRCPACGALNNSQSVYLFGASRGYRAAQARLLDWSNDLYGFSLDHATATCHDWTGHDCTATLALVKDTSGDEPCLSYRCPRCHAETWNRQPHNVIGLPEVRRFWRDHPRMRRLPSRSLESQGHSAVATGYASVTGGDRVDVVYARDSMRVLSIHRTGRRA